MIFRASVSGILMLLCSSVLLASPQEEAARFLDNFGLSAEVQASSREDLIRKTTMLLDRIESHLYLKPNDAPSWIIAARLSWLREMLLLEPTKNPKTTMQYFVEAQGYLDQARQLHPQGGEIDFWYSRLWSSEVPYYRDGQLAKRFVDLERARTHAEKACQLMGDQPSYLENWSEILMLLGRFREAEQVLTRLNKPSHPWLTLLQDFTRLPLPAQALPLLEEAREFGEQQWIRGRFATYPRQRVRMYWLPLGIDDIEDFYRHVWPDFSLMTLDSRSSEIAAHDPKPKAEPPTTWMQMLLLDRDPPQPVVNIEQLQGQTLPSIQLTLVEVPNTGETPRTRSGKLLPAHSGSTSCYLYLVNNRKLTKSGEETSVTPPD